MACRERERLDGYGKQYIRNKTRPQSNNNTHSKQTQETSKLPIVTTLISVDVSTWSSTNLRLSLVYLYKHRQPNGMCMCICFKLSCYYQTLSWAWESQRSNTTSQNVITPLSFDIACFYLLSTLETGDVWERAESRVVKCKPDGLGLKFWRARSWNLKTRI